MGTLLRSGDQLRATTQLVEAPGGTLLTSHTVQSSLGDLFQLQDDIARRVVDASSLPLTAATRRPRLTRRTMPAPMSSTFARTSWHAPTTGSRRRAICTSAAWSWIRASLRPGRTWAAATA